MLFHGRGADENDLFPLLDVLDPERRLARLQHRAGRSSLPPGGAHWYVVPRVGYPTRRRSRRRTGAAPEWLDARPCRTRRSWARRLLTGRV